MAWELVRAPLPISRMSARAMSTSPPSMVRILFVAPGTGGIVNVRVLNSGVKSKIERIMTDSRSRMEFAMRPISTSLLTLMEASLVKRKLCMGRSAYQSLLRNLVRLSFTISTPSISNRERFSAFSRISCSLRLPQGAFSPMKGSIFSMRSSTSALMASSLRMLHSRSRTS